MEKDDGGNSSFFKAKSKKKKKTKLHLEEEVLTVKTSINKDMIKQR